ncbi:MAG: carboxypeptidase-like regulatory domain-containing protein [Saprospiraceae bacterium]|nr:carboxypeptidase-like regulatory domain-containing protein [Saprospiraceae bacterium]
MKYLITLSLVFTTLFAAYSQSAPNTKTQTIRGKVVDNFSEMVLIGVLLMVDGTEITSITDENGNFVIENIPIGRQIIKAQYLGYEPYISEDLIISTTKEHYLDIKMKEQVQVTETVVVSASKGADNVGNRALNDLSVISTRSFSVEETKRYAASIDDPGRMAIALPGVQSDNDAANDVIIRGNPSMGVLWKLEDLELTNPNHFARPASTGGGITVFSAAVLGNTDFSTGAFAAEYGNAFSGVFDMRFRRGNMNSREHSVKIGLIGLGASTEGPIVKGRSSYLINYRYSFLGVLNAMKLYVQAPNAENVFQDLSFNLSFVSEDNKDELKIFGVGGLSNELWKIRDTSLWKTSWDYIGEVSGSHMGVLGASYRRLIDDKSYLRITAGAVYNYLFDTEFVPDFADPTNESKYDTTEINDYHLIRSQLHITYSNKLHKRFRLKTGLSGHAITYNLNYTEDSPDYGFHQFLSDQGTTFLLQGYATGSYRPAEKWTINFGFHALFFTLNNTYSIDPRVAIQYRPFKKTTLTAAYGIHSRILPIGTYLLDIPLYSTSNITTKANLNLDMISMHHIVLGYQQVLGGGFRTNLELYYQQGWNVPIENDSTSSFSYVNQRDKYGMVQMISAGKTRNYGVDLSIEKSFSNNFFVLATGSLFWSQYTALNTPEWQRTRVDKRWSSSVLAGYEVNFKKGGVLQIGLKTLFSGGLRYTPADETASRALNIYVEDDTRPFSEAEDLYFRADLRLSYRKDHKKLSYTISLDLQNVTNNMNVRNFDWDRQLQELMPRNQAGFLPVLSFQIDF